MDEIIIHFLQTNPILAKCNLTEQDMNELASLLRKHCISPHVERVVRMVEEVISIDPTLEWKEILEAAAKKIVQFLHADGASIRIFDPETDRLVAFGSFQYYSETGRQKNIPVEKSVAGKVIKSGRSYLVPNILLEPDYMNKDVVKELGLNSLMAVPIMIPGFLESEHSIQGSIQIYYREIDREFDPLEVANAELLARRVSYVLAKKRILNLQRLNIQKEKIVEKIFVKLSHREGIKMKDVFSMMIPELVNIIQVQSCTLFSVSSDRKHVQIELEYPSDQEIHEICCVYSVKDHPYFDALLHDTEKRDDYAYERITPSYILIKDPLKSRLSNDELKRYAARQNVNSVLLIPLKAMNEINYFLVFYAKDRRQEFTEYEIDLLSFFGKEIMKALRIEKLDDVLHDFKNPAVAIAGFAKRTKKLLENEDLASVKEKLSEYLDIIIQESVRMQELAIYPNIEGREREVDLSETLRRRFKINEEAIREQRRINIHLIDDKREPGLQIYCSPLGLERVLDNLLDNATKAIPEEGGKLSIKSYRSGDMAAFEIRNTGKIPEENIGQIKKGEVKGRGLNIIYRFIQANHGKLDVFTDNDSTIFRVMIPLHQ
ncbi:MAG TPA: GAF domain-containing sensor histidine kinase [Thermodesulfovibrionales bacterium]|jgi:signal transduction histidine kinase|nr:GAF domain-containing sensor histidine kinase [Thermodesulfovibrionales bacterium]